MTNKQVVKRLMDEIIMIPGVDKYEKELTEVANKIEDVINKEAVNLTDQPALLKCQKCGSGALILRRSLWVGGKIKNKALCVECGRDQTYSEEFSYWFERAEIKESQDAYRKRMKKTNWEDAEEYMIDSWEAIKDEMLLSDGGCVECGSQDNLQIDHIVPQYFGGSDKKTNLQKLCQKCNAIKKNRLQ